MLELISLWCTEIHVDYCRRECTSLVSYITLQKVIGSTLLSLSMCDPSKQERTYYVHLLGESVHCSTRRGQSL